MIMANDVNGQTKLDSPVIGSILIEPYKKREPTRAEKWMLKGEAQLLVVAGRSVYCSFADYVRLTVMRCEQRHHICSPNMRPLRTRAQSAHRHATPQGNIYVSVTRRDRNKRKPCPKHGNSEWHLKRDPPPLPSCAYIIMAPDTTGGVMAR